MQNEQTHLRQSPESSEPSLPVPDRIRVDSIHERVYDDISMGKRIAGKALDFSTLATANQLADASFWMTHEPPGATLY